MVGMSNTLYLNEYITAMMVKITFREILVLLVYLILHFHYNLSYHKTKFNSVLKQKSHTNNIEYVANEKRCA